MTKFEYHREDDVAVFEYGNYDSYVKSVEIANMVIDLGEDGKFLGMEIIGASEKLPLSKDQLENIESAQTSIEQSEDYKMITITMYENDNTSSLSVPVSESSTPQLA